ncbi:uncharacterized protein LOC124318219 [Daphnia pulicaria]|uniref:uncharacterized protein LOC124318219 n=1 Tax=Daphnia pulicaria TaxID=35523 RepID=UPI001EEB88E3|nr:uncharacterized protein LOC124318219 [Daphnia pulicaria]
MSLLNKFFGIKKEVPVVAPHTPVSVTNDTPESGFVMVPNAVESYQLHSGPLPYAINSNASSNQQDISSNKLYDEIPFQFSPAYNTMWLNGSTVKHKPKMLKEIDWDSLCYDFTLEKSILQS